MPLPKKLEHYQVSAKTGFLPFDPPLEQLPEYYRDWEAICLKLPSHIANSDLVEVVARLPLLSSGWLKSEPEYRRAYVILGFIADGLLWGSGKVVDVRSWIQNREGSKLMAHSTCQLTSPFLSSMFPLILDYLPTRTWQAKICGITNF